MPPSTCRGSLIGGAGVGLMIPTLTGAGASSLPPERFATGAAVLTMGRQIGAALGVAVLVAVLGTATRNAADFHSAWLISVAGGLSAGLLLAAIGAPVRRTAGGPVGGEAGETGARASNGTAGERPAIAEPIADPLIVEPLVLGGVAVSAVEQASATAMQTRTRTFSWQDPAATSAAGRRACRAGLHTRDRLGRAAAAADRRAAGL